MKTGVDLIKDIKECKVEKENAAFWWLGQISYVMKISDVVIYLDPFISEHPRRLIPPLLKPEQITNADFIFGSHDHTDHIDRKVWNALSKSSPGAKFIVPRILVEGLSKDLDIPLDRFIGLDDGVKVMHKGLTITGVPAAHELLDYDEATDSHPYLGFIIEGNGVTIYHSGDTCIYEGIQDKLRAWSKLDVMFLPINGRDGKRLKSNVIGNMTYQEAVDLAGTLNPGLVVPAHYEMFAANSEDPELFRDYLEIKYPTVKCWIGEHGEKVFIK